MEIRIQKKRKKTRTRFTENPTRIIVISFAVLIALGTLLLMMPFCSADGKFTPFMTAFFTATSATCVTGLILVDTGTYYSMAGQSVILFLIQVGGLGLVTFASLFHMLLRRKMRFRNVSLAQESVSASSFSEVRKLVQTIFIFSLLFELLGAGILCTQFVPKYGSKGIFISVFLSVSAYCNGGFDILGFEEPFCSVTNYADSPVVLITLMTLVACGGLGFLVWQDLYRYRYHKRLAFHTKLVLAMTGALIVGGSAVILFTEWNNPLTLGNMSFSEKIINSTFLSISARTAGFNSFSVADMRDITKVFCAVLMFVGAAPASTGGGIKVTTAVVLVMTVVCVLRNLPDTVFGRHRVNKRTVYKALTVAALGCMAIAALVVLICCTKQQAPVSLVDAVFEAASAFGTAGISDGVTAIANTPTRLALIAAMFLGRVGPVSLGMSIAIGGEREEEKTAYEQLPEGKILVG